MAAVENGWCRCLAGRLRLSGSEWLMSLCGPHLTRRLIQSSCLHPLLRWFPDEPRDLQEHAWEQEMNERNDAPSGLPAHRHLADGKLFSALSRRQRWGEPGATAASPLWLECHHRHIYSPNAPPPLPPQHPQGSKSISHYTDLKRLLSSFSPCPHHRRAANGFGIVFIVFCRATENASETVVNVDVKGIYLKKPSWRQTVALQQDQRLLTHLYKGTERE